MPKHFTPEERIEIEGRLLAAAKASFLYYGMNKTTVEDITQSAGVAKGTFYLFFKNTINFSINASNLRKRITNSPIIIR